MKLAYRGTTYQSATSAVEGVETQQTGLFLGNSFRIKQFNITQRQNSAIQLKYRGVNY
ncbi:MAG: DUF4278 domain-containing protein [Leptolyngbyaceae cyanobacterium SL_7_1]|nr:DUF4278 domain-containing protein [Leptolyngbyaceae cyanobacterium SL_7_1]